MRLDFKAPPKFKIKHSIVKSSMLKEVIQLKPHQIDAWIANNINNISDIRAIITEIIRVVAYILHSEKIIEPDDQDNN